MLGNSTTPGIMYLTMGEHFKQMRSHPVKHFVVKVSYLEVYNETLRDLLTDEENIVDIREDNKGVVVSGITEITVDTPEEVMNLLSYKSFESKYLTIIIGLDLKIEQWRRQEQMWFPQDLMQFYRRLWNTKIKIKG